jgi:hypothetical protein
MPEAISPARRPTHIRLLPHRFSKVFKETGYVERRNVAIEYRGRRIITIAYQYSRPIWFIVRWR